MSRSDEVALEQSGMALRKQVINDIVSESQQTDEDTQEDDDTDNKVCEGIRRKRIIYD